MGNGRRKDVQDSYAKIISVLFHPLFMPVYGLAIILFADTPFALLPFNVKKLLFLIMLVNNVFLPISLLPFLMQMNFISSMTLAEREERAVPMIITTILYATSSYIFYRFPVPHFIKSCIFATFLLSLVVTLINFRWKISLHATGAGALIGIVSFLALRLHSPVTDCLIVSVIAASLVMSSRLKLNLHNPQEVWGGFLTGLGGMILFLLFLQDFS